MSGFEDQLTLPLITILPILATGLLLVLKLHLKEAHRYLGAFHIILGVFIGAQLLQIKQVRLEGFFADHQSPVFFFTGFAIWIISGIAVFNRNLSFRFYYLGLYLIAIITAFIIFDSVRASDYHLLGHETSFLGSLLYACIAYLIFVVCTVLFIWKNAKNKDGA